MCEEEAKICGACWWWMRTHSGYGENVMESPCTNPNCKDFMRSMTASRGGAECESWKSERDGMVAAEATMARLRAENESKGSRVA